MNFCFAQTYHKILCANPPEFLEKYFSIPILSRLKGVGLLCGTDWTPFFKNNFFYSRFDHSVGVALIIWNFTHDKAQTIAGLLHDVSTPAFSHVSDFRKGDALTQTATEENNSSMLASSPELLKCLAIDELTLEQVNDYHKYPVADNEVPQLSADRLEYMFPSGAALAGNWSLTTSFTIEEIRQIYADIVLCKNEDGIVELGFKTLSIAELYFKRVLDIAYFLQQCEDKMAMQFQATILNMAVEQGIIKEADFFAKSESEIIATLDELLKTTTDSEPSIAAAQTSKTSLQSIAESKNSPLRKLCTYYKTYRTFSAIDRSNSPLQNHYCVNVQVKKRYINPLVVTERKNGSPFPAKRLTTLSAAAQKQKADFLNYKDAPFACVQLI